VIPLDIRPNMELNPWDDIPRAIDGAELERIGLLPNGTTSGRPTIGLLVRLPDGTAVIAQTTWTLMRAAVRALDASPVAELDRMEHPQ
jgi:hypothetical protein